MRPVIQIKECAKRALLSVLALARCATAVLESKGERGAENEAALLREELDLLRARLDRVDPRRRPHYSPIDRMRLLELMAVRGWNHEQAAERFLLTPITIATWLRRVDEDGDFVKTKTPINKIPDMVRYAVQRLKLFCPRLGKTKIAQILCRAGIEISATTVARVLREPRAPEPDAPQTSKAPKRRKLRRKPDDVWHVDLTSVPTRGSGFWLPWLPHAIAQCWPFCWWVVSVVDSASRRCHGTQTFKEKPNSQQIQAFLDRTIADVGNKPTRIITDREKQFDCKAFREWKKSRGIRHRFGKLGVRGGPVVIERFFLSLKKECTQRIWVPLRAAAFGRELTAWVDWYNGGRPHSALAGRTPDEAYFGDPADVPVDLNGKVIQIMPFKGRPNLPVVRLVDAA